MAALVLSLLGFFVANVSYGVLFPGCADCHDHVGVPFAYLDTGGYDGGGGLLWRGVFADSAIILGTALALSRGFQRLRSHKRS